MAIMPNEEINEAVLLPTEEELNEILEQLPTDSPVVMSSDQVVITSDTPIVLAAPAPVDDSSVSSSDLLTFVGSGAHDFIAYAISDDESYCIYPVRISDTGQVTGENCTTITISDPYRQNRSIRYGTDDISLTLDGSSYVYSDMTGPYITLWSAEAARSPLDSLSTYLLIAFCALSIFGSLVRRLSNG